jgi:type IV secretory pathway VirB2 component (pilin)
MKLVNFVKKTFLTAKPAKLVAAVYGSMLAFTPAFHTFAARTWPWTGILNDIKDELTGPLPMTLGILGIVVAAIGLFAGNAGDGMRRFLIILFAISIALFAPTIVQWIADGM